MNISIFFKLPTDITQYIYFYIINNINNSYKIITDKWYSYINIHSINLCYIANQIPILQAHTLFGDTISYYNLNDINFNITLSICAKYIKPRISDKNWWCNFAQNGYNGLIFINNDNDYIIQRNISLIDYILSVFYVEVY
jgi:hypothetical protein